MSLKQTLQQKQQNKLSPLQIQLLKYIEFNALEIDEATDKEVEDNPLLEKDNAEVQKTSLEDIEKQGVKATPYNVYKGENNPYPTHIIEQEINFDDLLSEQIRMKFETEKQQEMAMFIVGSLDDDGYLRRNLMDVGDDLMFQKNIETSEKELKTILQMVQTLDPSGIGARDLKECLLLQLKRKNTQIADLAYKILDEYFDLFTKKHFDKIEKKSKLTHDNMQAVLSEITKLNPKPANSIKTNAVSNYQIIPDFIISKHQGDMSISLHEKNNPLLSINQSYIKMIDKMKIHNDEQKKAKVFLEEKYKKSKMFIEGLKQRKFTLIKTMHAILQHQKDFFSSGDTNQIVPLTMKNLAVEIEMDISTVSRAVKNKYVQTPNGIYPLKYFFGYAMDNSQGEVISTKQIKNALKEVIDEESKQKPLSDQKLTDILVKKGYNISRRTVTKYREQADIPVARLRKEMM